MGPVGEEFFWVGGFGALEREDGECEGLWDGDDEAVGGEGLRGVDAEGIPGGVVGDGDGGVDGSTVGGEPVGHETDEI